MMVTSSSMTDTDEGQSWCRLVSAPMAEPSYVSLIASHGLQNDIGTTFFDSIGRAFASAIGDDFVLMHANTHPHDA